MRSPGTSRSQRASHFLEESNSTASLFLGSVQKDWMTSVGERPYPLREPRAADKSASKATKSHHGRSASEISQEASHLGSTEISLPSPVTPGTELSSAASSQPLPSLSIASKLTASTAFALPSPVPSPGSHLTPASPRLSPPLPPPLPPPLSSTAASIAIVATSPTATSQASAVTATAALETRAPTPPRRDEADTGLAQSTLSHQARCSVHISKGISTGSSSETQTRVASSQPNPVRLGNCAPPEQSSQPVDGQPDPSPQNLRCFQFSPSTVPLSTSTAEESHANESQLHQVTPEGLPQSLKMTPPVAGTWTLWSQNAEQLIKHANTLRSGIGGPRAALLLKACSKRDIVYIVLHQLFCEVYRDPPGFFARFPALGNEHCVSGMHKLADLLADNSALPRALVDAFCDYPWAIGKTVQASWFPAVFEMVRDCLMKLADRLTVDAIRHFYERGYPPLVMELTQQYCAKSPVLCEVIFLSTCRRLYEHWKIDLLERIYHKNQFLVDRNAPEKAIAALIEDYRAVPMKRGLCAAPGESQLSSSHNLNRVARQTGGATKSRGDDAQFNQPGSSTAPSPTQRQNEAAAQRPGQFPSIRPVPVSSPRVQMSQSQPVQSRSAGISPLLPPEGYRAPLTVQPQPMRLGIHQADLRDPVKQLVKKTPDGVEDIHLYQYLGEFLIRPTGVDPEVFSYRWKVSISASDYQRISRPVQRENGQRSLQVYQSGSRIYRLRIISVPNSQTQSIETIWSTASTTWPSVMYIFVNQNEMYVRRKVHNGKDLPLDISAHLREGENEVNLHFLLGPGECRSTHYEAAVEIMEICEYDEILAQIRRRPACETRADITKRLSSRIDDDELAIVTDSLTVPLIDPFMAQVFKVPVRSVNCTHIECFDLEAFVTTRKSNSGSQPLNDNWLCPVCKADARPQLLVIDEFFVDVREALERGGLIENAQSIQVGANGTWTVKSLSVAEYFPAASVWGSGDRGIEIFIFGASFFNHVFFDFAMVS
ncbi:hypothetical protein PDE_05289 [Penicillium oxalicum 114-2]|uniref:SP-RING-type domain-containing protein n=1 Tax=Penicillium oxalicum (strain 114-2 / CGMCC 5302) TaxID=933388 RepID=S8AVT9_PENO1|nr:hypothetical protein PDE_05289 [Penicillium oxalicum 114-2]